VKFLYADSLDFVDPAFDFALDRPGAKRRPHEHDDFPHEHLDAAPYDGLLVSRAIVGDARRPGKYSEPQAMRFRREGARAFLRFPESRFPGSLVMGDNGAFTYREEVEPPFTIDDTLEFYEDGGFTHGCSIDHLIFDFLDDGVAPSAEAKRRSEITLAFAAQFLPAAKALGPGFTPLGVVQGWSASSMADAARDLVAMGYDYLAVGGMVPLKIEQIERALSKIRAVLPDRVALHILGFGKTDDLHRLEPYGVASFDTTSPLLRAFKDGWRNYYARSSTGELSYYTAIRIPQALENDRLARAARSGRLDQDSLLHLEAAALGELRAYAGSAHSSDAALAAVLEYGRYALWDDTLSEARNEQRLTQLRAAYSVTLADRPWEYCGCRVCRESGVEAVIFRSSNRNKRRGIHNLHVFYDHLKNRAAPDGRGGRQ
jgi:hypothetical protein